MIYWQEVIISTLMMISVYVVRQILEFLPTRRIARYMSVSRTFATAGKCVIESRIRGRPTDLTIAIDTFDGLIDEENYNEISWLLRFIKAVDISYTTRRPSDYVLSKLKWFINNCGPESAETRELFAWFVDSFDITMQTFMLKVYWSINIENYNAWRACAYLISRFGITFKTNREASTVILAKCCMITDGRPLREAADILLTDKHKDAYEIDTCATHIVMYMNERDLCTKLLASYLR